ncbi:FAD binding domain-containing protein [Prosthecomicrobium pneumaticum]|uniref:Xanthine dehydrogenase YagS FAD-binding subunit n=1 Tax=Prosthecomicrobium pneumaticum TaxID=81895 RepID=A0A7W9FM10_9HYPH|nr:FAD binding domain-containing protein [Prosthecomicrobium pneumaticum]MBB5753121.1 xanthine dehydrogenase YagS FAD-binding subunit [Prosthecomicrobium pneumaticum]
MRRFAYLRPARLEEALAAAAEPETAWLAGGTNLVELMKRGVARPARLVDLAGLEDLATITPLAAGGLSIGAAVRNADLARHPVILRDAPILAEAVLSAAAPQIRNRATTAGNLLQAPRCAGFLDPGAACNRRAAGSGCAARGGDGRDAAVLGATEACIAVHPSDLAVPLVALDARLRVAGRDGERTIALGTLYGADGASTLPPGELVRAVLLPAEAAGFAGHARYLKLRERTSFAFALVSAAAALRIAGGRIVAARVALGGVAPRPWRPAEAEAVLAGAVPTDALFRAAADAALAAARPIAENGFKIELARRVLVRALTLALRGTPARVPALAASPFAPAGEGARHG